MQYPWLQNADGALLVKKPAGLSSFGVIDRLQKGLGLRRAFRPKMGHGGTLDPFATGLLVVCVGRGVKLARYFLGSKKTYQATVKFGESTPSGDPTLPISETSQVLPTSLQDIQTQADLIRAKPYFQTPPMFSAKKKDGVPLYELARDGIEVERQAKLCQIYEFTISSYSPPLADFEVVCSAGTYVRTLAQDLAQGLGTLAHLRTLNRLSSGRFDLSQAQDLDTILEAIKTDSGWPALSCWVPFNEMLLGYPSVSINEEEQLALIHGKQHVLGGILARSQGLRSDFNVATLCYGNSLLAIARRENGNWGLERVFVPNE